MICEYKIGNIDVYKFVMPVITSNMYLMIIGSEALMIDPNVSDEAVFLLKEKGVKKIIILLTHEHFDHISGVNFFREEWNCTVYGNNDCRNLVTDPAKNLSAFFMGMFISKSDEERWLAQDIFMNDYTCTVDVGFEGIYKLEVGSLMIQLIETPGHSMGSICAIVNDAYIFTGDSLVQGEKTITRLPGGSKRLWQEVTKPFFERLDKNMIVFPGHGEERIIKELEIG